jgi:hypothetical protein
MRFMPVFFQYFRYFVGDNQGKRNFFGIMFRPVFVVCLRQTHEHFDVFRNADTYARKHRHFVFTFLKRVGDFFKSLR